MTFGKNRNSVAGRTGRLVAPSVIPHDEVETSVSLSVQGRAQLMARDRLGPPFHADHVGSLLRPRALVNAFKAHRAGKLDDDAFVAAQDQAIRDVVRRQEAVGLSSITDGEFRRLSYWARFVERVAGLEVREACFNFHDEAGQNQ